MAGGRVRSFCGGWTTLTPHKGNYRVTQCDSVYIVRHARGSYTVYTHCCLWKWPHQKTNQFLRRCHPHARESASKAVLSKMQPTLHATGPTPHGASHLVQAMPSWSAKTRRALSRHCRDGRVYGHTTTAMHCMSTPPHPSPHP